MAFKVTEGFRNIQVGDNQVLTIKKVAFDEEFQKARITFQDSKGGTLTEMFAFLGKDGKPNNVAIGIVSTICKCILGCETDEEVELEDIVGGKVLADAYLQITKNEQGEETGRYTHLRNFREYEDENSGEWY